MNDVVEVRAPVENVNDETIEILNWLVQDGDRVEKDAPLLLAETTKTSFDVPSPAAGFVWKVVADPGEVPTGAILCYVGDDLERVRQAAADARGGSAVPTAAAQASSVPPDSADPSGDGTADVPRFSGKALSLLKELGLDASDFTGRGLVRERDVLALSEARRAAASTQATAAVQAAHSAPAAAPPPAEEPVRSASATGVPTRVEKLPRSKRLEAQYLRSAVAGTVPSMATIAVPTRGFFRRAQAQPELVGLPAAAIIFETSRLLRRYPLLNAFHHDGEAHVYEDVNIGYALDIGKGLKVPVLHQADRRSLQDIAAEKQQRLIEYLNDSLSVESLSGGTFTITDLSGDDVFHFNPLLNQRQSAILGVCAEMFANPGGQGVYNLVLAFDHQLAEGRTAAVFLRELRDRLMGHEDSFRRQIEDQQPEPSCSVCFRPVTELNDSRHFLLRTIADRSGGERVICSICLQLW